MIFVDAYSYLGCWAEYEGGNIASANVAIPVIKMIDIGVETVFGECLELAKSKGYTVFGIGKWTDGNDVSAWLCTGAETAGSTYRKLGESTKCGSNGLGGPYANAVYEIKLKYV